MKRDIANICSGDLDVLVVGGGIHGAAIAYHAARAGYRTAVVEQNDFCSGTSANSLKILHGGLRYLQHGNLKRMRHSICSRREMMQLAPYLVEPLPCMMPLYGRGTRGKMAMRTALFINDCVSWDRNKGLPERLHLPGGHLISNEQCLEVVPGVEQRGLRGAAVWYDVLALDTERMVIEYLLESVRYGAHAVNYTKVTAVDAHQDGVYTVKVHDQQKGQDHQIRSRFVVNAAGPWFEECFFSEKKNKPQKQLWALALNLVSRKKIFNDYAVALEGRDNYQDSDAIIKRDKRLYFFVPWRGHTMIGTEYEPCSSRPDELKVTRETLQKMIDEVNSIYPAAGLGYDDISFYHAGLLPMRNDVAGDGVQLEKNSAFVTAEDDRAKGILSLKSVKYTTAPHIAREVVQYLRGKIEPSGRKIDSGTESKEDIQESVSEPASLMLQQRYGPRWQQVARYRDKGKGQDKWIGNDTLLLTGEVDYLVNEEMASRLSDIVLRRTGLGTAACPAEDLLNATAKYMGSLLGWDKAQIEKEVEDVLQRYAPLTLPGTSSGTGKD